jgi:hypothetical protein
LIYHLIPFHRIESDPKPAPSPQYDFRLIGPAAAALGIAFAAIAWRARQRRRARLAARRRVALFGGLATPPARTALRMGRRWRATAKARAAARREAIAAAESNGGEATEEEGLGAGRSAMGLAAHLAAKLHAALPAEDGQPAAAAAALPSSPPPSPPPPSPPMTRRAALETFLPVVLRRVLVLAHGSGRDMDRCAGEAAGLRNAAESGIRWGCIPWTVLRRPNPKPPRPNARDTRERGGMCMSRVREERRARARAQTRARTRATIAR